MAYMQLRFFRGKICTAAVTETTSRLLQMPAKGLYIKDVHKKLVIFNPPLSPRLLLSASGYLPPLCGRPHCPYLSSERLCCCSCIQPVAMCEPLEMDGLWLTHLAG